MPSTVRPWIPPSSFTLEAAFSSPRSLQNPSRSSGKCRGLVPIAAGERSGTRTPRGLVPITFGRASESDPPSRGRPGPQSGNLTTSPKRRSSWTGSTRGRARGTTTQRACRDDGLGRRAGELPRGHDEAQARSAFLATYGLSGTLVPRQLATDERTEPLRRWLGAARACEPRPEKVRAVQAGLARPGWTFALPCRLVVGGVPPPRRDVTEAAGAATACARNVAAPVALTC